jgi:hypothetical protein
MSLFEGNHVSKQLKLLPPAEGGGENKNVIV